MGDGDRHSGCVANGGISRLNIEVRAARAMVRTGHGRCSVRSLYLLIVMHARTRMRDK